MKINISDYLGVQISTLFQDEPFKNWLFERSAEEDLEDLIVHYVFPENGLEIRCDSNERISVIFLFSDEHGGFDDSLIEHRFSWTRQQVLENFGNPSKSGNRNSHPILGEYGAWDRFAMTGYTVRFEYGLDVDRVKKITFMRNDVVP